MTNRPAVDPGLLRKTIGRSRRWVIKIGSALTTEQGLGLNSAAIETWAEQMVELQDAGRHIVVVASGSVAEGAARLGWSSRPHALNQLQAAAAIGQMGLIRAWDQAYEKFGRRAAQVLLTHEDLSDRQRYLNAKSTLLTLLELGVFPVVNENDTVATSEIRVGDNDRLGARVAAMIGADALVLLSDIDGLYTADPKKDSAATFVPLVEEITPEIEAMAGKAPLGYSSGGMVTKLAAARIAVDAGCRMAIADGRRLNPLAAIEEGRRCTWFNAAIEPRSARKLWIAGSLKTVGSFCLDAGALAALKNGKSLLPAGVTAVEGQFERGDTVALKGPDGCEVARGLSAYGAPDARLIIGHKSREIGRILGYSGREELIHRDDLVMLRNAGSREN